MLPLVRQVARAAYEAGARFVDVIWGDEEIMRLRAEKAPADSFGEYPAWHINGLLNVLERGDALLSVGSNNPDLLNGLDPDRVSAMQKTHLENYKPVSMAVSRNAINWCVVAASKPVWAEKIFPALSPKRAETKLWKAIFETTRVDQPDPIAAWMEHIQNLVKRSEYLQAKQFTALHYKGPGTDFFARYERRTTSDGGLIDGDVYYFWQQGHG